MKYTISSVLLFTLLVSFGFDAAAQQKTAQLYNTLAVEGATVRWTGKDMNVSTVRVAPGVRFGGHWILFMPFDVNIDMHNTQTTKNFGIVIAVLVVMGLFIFGLDSGLYAILGLIMGTGSAT